MVISDASNRMLSAFEASLNLNGSTPPEGPLYAGVDLGTAYVVTAVVDSCGTPVAGVLTRGRSIIRDGLVLDYVGAIEILRRQVQLLNNSGYALRDAAAAYPPGTTGNNVRAFGNVLQAVGLELTCLVDEPSAAALVLGISDGGVVDIGGGTTGISIIRGGHVIYTADEATGGIHVDLVLAGHYRISVEEAEGIKQNPQRQAEIFPIIKPVFQKMASIVRHHLKHHPVKTLYMVGGTSCFPGIEAVMREETGLEVLRPHHPLLVTPLGIALSCLAGGLQTVDLYRDRI